MRRCTKRDVLAYVLAGSAMIVALAFGQAAKAQDQFGGNQQGGQQGGQDQQQGQQGQQGQGMGQDNQKQGQDDKNGMDMPNEDMMGGEDGGMGQSGEQESKMKERELKNMQRQMKSMELGINKLDKAFLAAEKKGIVIPEEVKENLAKAKEILAATKNAKSMDDLESVDPQELGDLMQSLGDAQREIVENAQRLEGIKRGMKGAEQGLRNFEKQVERLKKQGVPIPAEMAEDLTKAKTIIVAVKNAKSWEDAEAAGIEDLKELFDEKLSGYGESLEQLARWPQTVKQVDAELKRLTTALGRAKKIVDRLGKKGSDFTSEYQAFETAIKELRSVRDDAASKAKDDIEEAFNVLEEQFFGQVEEVWQHMRTIETVEQLAKFVKNFEREFKQGIQDARRRISKLKRMKNNVTELEDLLKQAQEKGAEIRELFKKKPIDEEAFSEAYQELEGVKQQFDEQAQELEGVEELMPWETGEKQFKNLKLDKGMSKFLPDKPRSSEDDEGEEGNI